MFVVAVVFRMSLSIPQEQDNAQHSRMLSAARALDLAQDLLGTPRRPKQKSDLVLDGS